jgi:transcriptional regulator with XRE-family HTH domain
MYATSRQVPVSDVARRIQDRRLQLGLSIDDVARRAGVARGYLEWAEQSPDARLSSTTLFKVAKGLDTTSQSLLGCDLLTSTPPSHELPLCLRRVRFLSRATDWLEPESNPSAVVYGVLAMGVLIAAEGARRESYATAISASSLALVLYWLAHAYSRHFGERLERPDNPGIQWIGPALLREAAMLKGASLPVVAMLICWVLATPLSSGITAALWTAGVELLVLELLAGVRRKLSALEMAVEVGLSVVFGVGLFCIRLLLS